MASFLEGGVVGLAIGEAGGAIVEPALEPTRQEAEKAVHARILEMRELAELVATTLHTLAEVEEDALRNGYDADALKSSVQLALKAPPYSEVLDLWRRNATRPASEQISEAQVDHALGKAAIEYQYWPALKELVNARLSQQVIATAIQRGVMNAPFELPYNAQVGPGKITPFPVSTLDTEAEAMASGVDLERLRVETALIGLPMALDRAARAKYRGIIDENDFLRAVLEGNARGEWAQAELEVAREIPTAHDFVENHLRGYSDATAMYSGAALHGMTQANVDLIFQNAGRPLNVHQITTGLARGGVFEPIPGEITDPYQASVHESNIKPSYYDLAIANRYSYPSLFQLNALVKGNAITADTAKDWATKDGLAPEVVTALYTFWQSEQAPTVDKHVSSSRTSLVTATRKAYVGGSIDKTKAETALTTAGVSSSAQASLFTLWDAQRAVETSASA